MKQLLFFALLASGLDVFAKLPSFEQLKEKAEAGDKDAQYEVGLRYLDGKSSIRDKAVKWLISASELGHTGAQYLLGDLYHRSYFKVPGLGFDINRAMKWYESAATAGALKAQLALARIYGSGARGVSKDTLLSEKWQAKATEQYQHMAKEGDINAQYVLGGYYKSGKGGLKASRLMALKWYESAAMGGHKKAMPQCYVLYSSKDRMMAYAWSLTAHYFGERLFASGKSYLDREQQLKAEAVSRDLVKQISANMKAKNP
jgi:TPR repeat protein